MAKHFWRDAGSRRVFVRGIDGLHDDLRMVIRTTTSSQIHACDAKLRSMLGADEEAKRKVMAEFIANQIIEWDAEDDEGPASITAENIMELQPALGRRVGDIVYGVDGGDRDPLLEKPHREDTASRKEQTGNFEAA